MAADEAVDDSLGGWRTLTGAAARAALWMGSSALAIGGGASVAGCQQDYRIGEQILVKYGLQDCVAYVVAKPSKSRLRVHFQFEGYDWEDTVSADRVIGTNPVGVKPCTLPKQVRLRLGLQPTPRAKSHEGPYRVGERVQVRWRGAVYSATVREVIAPDRLIVHYSGYESAWDEAIGLDRIAAGRR